MLVAVPLIILRILGGLVLAIGASGRFVPVWPTTIFWILAALCFARSSPAARDWIYARPGIGPTIQTFIESGGLSNKSKIAALGGMALAAGLIAFLLWAKPNLMAAGLVLLGLAATYVATRPSS